LALPGELIPQERVQKRGGPPDHWIDFVVFLIEIAITPASWEIYNYRWRLIVRQTNWLGVGKRSVGDVSESFLARAADQEVKQCCERLGAICAFDEAEQIHTALFSTFV
jgi:hypothetical protein